jgi:hypothetical protein
MPLEVTHDTATGAFKYQLSQRVKLTESAEEGKILARAEYHKSYGDPQYYVRYKAADGRQVQDWWAEDAIEAA